MIVNTIIVNSIISFILSLARSLSDDLEFACSGWRSEISYCQIFHWIHIGDSSLILWHINLGPGVTTPDIPPNINRRLVIYIIYRYFYYYIFIFLFLYLSWSLTPFCRYSYTYLMLKYLCVLCLFPELSLSIHTWRYFALRMYVVVASPYLRDRGVTQTFVRRRVSSFEGSFTTKK